MTRNEKIKITERINEFADKVLKDVDRKSTPISQQLDALKPIMEEIGQEYRMSLSDVFVLYMDMNSELSAQEAEDSTDDEIGRIIYQ